MRPVRTMTYPPYPPPIFFFSTIFLHVFAKKISLYFRFSLPGGFGVGPHGTAFD
jgi:hypothetical protein